MILAELHKENIEEYWNVVTHFTAAVLTVIGALYLFTLADLGNQDFKFLSAMIFSIGMLMVYTTSTLYHYNWNKPYLNVYRTMDHISIFYLIAGTYTPFLLITFPEQTGWRMLLIVWAVAFFGTIFKFFFTGKYEKFSLLLYVLLGWTILLEFRVFLNTTPPKTLYLLMTGGLLYCIGVVFYTRKARFSHTIWHVFVMLANLCHYLAVVSIL